MGIKVIKNLLYNDYKYNNNNIVILKIEKQKVEEDVKLNVCKGHMLDSSVFRKDFTSWISRGEDHHSCEQW